MIKLKFSLTKREKIIITSIILSLGLLNFQFVPFILIFWYIGILTFAAFLLSLWSLWEGLNKLKAVVLLILPTFFTLAFSGYYFLIIPLWLRIIISLLFGITFYSLLLSQNIFNVSSIRTIPLYRVSSTVAFVLTIFTSTLLFNDLLSFNLLFIWNGLLIFALSFPLVLQTLWTVEMEGISRQMLVYSLLISLILGEVGAMLSFWPIYKPLASVILGVHLLVILNIVYDSLRDKLSRGEIMIGVGLNTLIFAIAFLFTSWKG